MSVMRNRYSPVETAADLPLYCGTCGRLLIDDTHKVGHDRQTGAPVIAVAVHCSKGHEAFVVAPVPPSFEGQVPPPRERS